MAFGSDKTAATVAAPDVQNVGLWNSGQHLRTSGERRLLWKLDLGILLAASFGWFMRYVDQANLTSAYVSGMKEDLNITGNQYTYMNTSYLVAFSIMQLPSSIIGLKIRPSIWLFSCEIGWTIFTFAQAGARTSTHMYLFRFMVGLFESAFSPVIIFLLGSWYTKRSSLSHRTSTWLLTGFLGEACSGFMQAAIYGTLDGRNGLAGWRWMYIVCGIMSVPSAFLCLLLLPEYPSNTRTWYLTEEDRRLALQRNALAAGPASGFRSASGEASSFILQLSIPLRSLMDP
ncbi:MFS general substrate transporter [Mycena chlorophos]|uniref:MFS general substrate transporter n=1 Tax=Mycena chlorophos TaxID=658473 RepID=A0A8H6SDF0_MYCCL|nr:MFS general substrate transporter [Mycena chlorophos]